MTRQYLIDADTLEAVGRFLLARPMAEVEGLVNALRQSTSYEPPVEPAPTVPAPPRQRGPRLRQVKSAPAEDVSGTTGPAHAPTE